jgi:hypothetical protein
VPTERPNHPVLADPWTREQIEAAVAPYVHLLSAEQLAWMREQLAETLATDEHAAKVLRRARPHLVEESGELGTELSDEVTPPPGERHGAG